MILVIQYKDSGGEYLNYSVIELDDLEKVAVKLREAIDQSAEERYGVGYIYLEFYENGEEILNQVEYCHQYVHTALTTILTMKENVYDLLC